MPPTSAPLDRALRQVRAALATGLVPGAQAAHPGRLQTAAGGSPEALRQQFVEQATGVGATVHTAPAADVAAPILAICARLGASAALAWDDRWLPDGLSAALRHGGIELIAPVVPHDPRARLEALTRLALLPLGLTGAIAGLAHAGSIVVTSGPGRSRLASLLPPVHVAVLQERLIVASLRTLLATEPERLGEGSNAVVITGPSRSADIELTLARGVHGPKELHVVLVS